MHKHQCSGNHDQVAIRISDKNEKVSRYRANLPKGSQVWLLLYSSAGVPSDVQIPHGTDEWRFPFDFEKVFWFSSLSQKAVEIHRSEFRKLAI